MKNSLPSAIILLIASASSALASNGAGNSGLGLMTILFFGFFALVIATQLLPGLLLFIAGTKSLFGKRTGQTASNR